MAQVVIHVREYDPPLIYKDDYADLIIIDLSDVEVYDRKLLASIKEKLDRITIPEAKQEIQEIYNEILEEIEADEEAEAEARQEAAEEEQRRRLILADSSVQQAIAFLESRGLKIVK